MDTPRDKGRSILRDMLGGSFAAAVEGAANSEEFGAHLAARALDDCYGHYWADTRLDRRSRSLVTLGILIALRADSEIKNHVRGALANGLSPDEIEAVIEHAVAYVGYPTAGAALTKAIEVLADKRGGKDIVGKT